MLLQVQKPSVTARCHGRMSRQDVSDSQQKFNAGSRSRKSQQQVSNHSSQKIARRCHNKMPRKDVRARCVKGVPQHEVTAGCLSRTCRLVLVIEPTDRSRTSISRLPRQDATGRLHGKMLAQDATARCHGRMSQLEVATGCHSKT